MEGKGESERVDVQLDVVVLGRYTHTYYVWEDSKFSIGCKRIYKAYYYYYTRGSPRGQCAGCYCSLDMQDPDIVYDWIAWRE